jgi:hypothetical protein
MPVVIKFLKLRHTRLVPDSCDTRQFYENVDSIIVIAEQHLEERLGNGETDSVLTLLANQRN